MRNLQVSDCRHLKVTGTPVEIHEEMLVTGPCQDVVLEFHECDCALDDLPQANQRFLRPVALEGLSYEETAQQLGVPVGTAGLDPPAQRVQKVLATPIPGSNGSTFLM